MHLVQRQDSLFSYDAIKREILLQQIKHLSPLLDR